MKLKYFLFFIFVLLEIKADGEYYFDCEVDYSLMHAIAKNERSIKREVGYPFLISFNNKKDVKTSNNVKILDNAEKLNSRSFDCYSKKNCSMILGELIENQIVNIDLGAFQLNYRYWKKGMKNEDFFDIEQSYIKACSILSNLIDRHGYSWDTIARYHSSTDKHKNKYLKSLITNYR